MADDPISSQQEKIVSETSKVEVAQSDDKEADLQNKYLRALADYQNLQRQTQNWKEEFSQYATLELIKKLLEVLDDLENAQTHLNDSGLQLIVAKLKKILADEGVTEIDVAGQEYDPNLAEAVSTQPGEKEHMVVTVLQKGYKLGKNVVRPAKVIVSTTAS